MDAGTMKDYIDDLIIKVNDACKAMEEAEIVVAGLRAEVQHWKALYEATHEEAKDLHEHLGEALYCEDGWRLREYAIVSYSRYARKHHGSD